MARKFFASITLASVALVVDLGLTTYGADDQPSDKISTTQSERMPDKDKASGGDKMSDKDETTGKDTMADKGKPSDKDKMTGKDKPFDKDKTTGGSMEDKETDGSTRNDSMIDG